MSRSCGCGVGFPLQVAGGGEGERQGENEGQQVGNALGGHQAGKPEKGRHDKQHGQEKQTLPANGKQGGPDHLPGGVEIHVGGGGDPDQGEDGALPAQHLDPDRNQLRVLLPEKGDELR